jgi:hypothetical protein
MGAEGKKYRFELLEGDGTAPDEARTGQNYGHSAGSDGRLHYGHFFRAGELFENDQARDQRFHLDGTDVVRAAFYNSPTAIDKGFADLSVVGCDRDVAKAAEQAQADGNVRLGVHPDLFECGIQEVFEVNPVDTDARNSMEVVKARFGQIS